VSGERAGDAGDDGPAERAAGLQAETEPVIPVTHLACGDQLHDQGAAYLAVGAVAWCAVHGNTEVISADEWAAAWQAEEAAPAAPVLACGERPYPAGSTSTGERGWTR
jgi:hypothetical protein